MKHPCVFWISLMLVLASPPDLFGNSIVELDLDGITGNGPDLGVAEVSDFFEVDVWLFGDLSLYSFGLRVRNFSGTLDYWDLVHHIPDGWTPSPQQPTLGVEIQATDFSFSTPLLLPAMVATITYHAAIDNSLADLTILDAGWLSTSMSSGTFDEMIGAQVQIGTTGIESASWSAIKSLFR